MIHYRLAAIEQYFIYIQDENKFNRISKYYIEMSSGISQHGQWPLTATIELAMEIWGDMNKFVFCSRGNVLILFRRIVWRYQRGNQNPYIEEKQTTQWPKYTVQKDKQQSTKDTHKTKVRVIRTPIKIRVWTYVLRKGGQFLLN